MLVTFYSDAYENIIMFENIALKLIKLMGHSGAIPGALMPKDLPDALSNLEIELKKRNDTESTNSIKEEDEEPAISLSHRAFPLINMLKAAIKKDCNVMWRYQ